MKKLMVFLLASLVFPYGYAADQKQPEEKIFEQVQFSRADFRQFRKQLGQLADHVALNQFQDQYNERQRQYLSDTPLTGLPLDTEFIVKKHQKITREARNVFCVSHRTLVPSETKIRGKNYSAGEECCLEFDAKNPRDLLPGQKFKIVGQPVFYKTTHSVGVVAGEVYYDRFFHMHFDLSPAQGNHGLKSLCCRTKYRDHLDDVREITTLFDFGHSLQFLFHVDFKLEI